jgi:hypothetical protein
VYSLLLLSPFPSFSVCSSRLVCGYAERIGGLLVIGGVILRPGRSASRRSVLGLGRPADRLYTTESTVPCDPIIRTYRHQASHPIPNMNQVTSERGILSRHSIRLRQRCDRPQDGIHPRMILSLSLDDPAVVVLDCRLHSRIPPQPGFHSLKADSELCPRHRSSPMRRALHTKFLFLPPIPTAVQLLPILIFTIAAFASCAQSTSVFALFRLAFPRL